MFNLGFGEILVICVVLIIVVGPERLPAVMKNVGKTLRTVRQASREIQTTVGLDELWREDVLAPPPPRPRTAPPATVSRAPEPAALPAGAPAAPAPADAGANTNANASPAPGTTATATPATPSTSTSATEAGDTSPNVERGGGKGEA
jgi:Tat protein translocase TatB subunit